MDAKTCKGEEDCGKNGRPDGGRGLKGDPADIDSICARCPFLPTKSTQMPLHIAPLVMIAYRMEALFESGAGVQYPNFYTPLEWEAFLTLKHCRAKADDKDLPAAPKPPNPAVQAALGARVKR